MELKKPHTRIDAVQCGYVDFTGRRLVGRAFNQQVVTWIKFRL